MTIKLDDYVKQRQVQRRESRRYRVLGFSLALGIALLCYGLGEL